MLIGGIVAFIMINIAVGAFIYIPVTLVAIIWMFTITKLLKRVLRSSKIPIYILISFIASIILLIYVLFTYWLYGKSLALIELITASNQILDSVMFGTFFCHVLRRITVQSKYKSLKLIEKQNHKTLYIS